MTRIALINPPLGSVEQPFLALAALQGHLKAHGYSEVRIWDVSQRILTRMLSGAYLRKVLDGLEPRIARFEQESQLSGSDILAYEAAIRGRAAALAAIAQIDDAVATLRDAKRFYVIEAYRAAMDAVDQAFEAVSGLSFPEAISRRNYTGSLLQDLDTDDELRAYLTEPERCLFHAEYLRGELQEIVASQPAVVGLSATFQDQFLPALVLARLLKQALPSAFVVMGGAFLASRLAEIRRRPWLFDYVDAMVVGEGETALLELVEALEQGSDLTGVPNLLRRRGATVELSDRQVTEDLSELHLPDYTGYDISLYLAPGWDVLYDPTRGCYWNQCAFCTVSISTRRAARQREAIRIVDDMEALCARYETRLVSFSTDAIPVPLLRQVSEEILRRGLDVGWTSEFILDRQLDRPSLELFASAGCLMLLFGFESANPRVVRAMRKGTLPERSARIIQDCSEAGIAVLLHIMAGFPGETEEELAETLAFVERMGSQIDFFELNAFHLDTDAPLFQSPESFGLTGVGRLKRVFNGQSLLPYQVSAGIPIERAAELEEAARGRLERAIGFAQRPFLHQDGAQLHHYLKAFGRQSVRQLRADRISQEQPGAPEISRGVTPVCTPFDLKAVNRTASELYRRHQALLLTTNADGGSLWQDLRPAPIARSREFLGAISDANHILTELDPASYQMLTMLQAKPDLFRNLSRLSDERRTLTETVLHVLEEHGLVSWRRQHERDD